jgi:hypothetical protein
MNPKRTYQEEPSASLPKLPTENGHEATARLLINKGADVKA